MRERTDNLLTITVNDFGPIKEGKVTLRPLTIFFGKNNTGKTYMGYLIWGALQLSSLSGDMAIDPTIKNTIDEITKIIEHYSPNKKHKKFPFGDYNYVTKITIKPTITLTKGNIHKIFNFPVTLKNAKISTLHRVDIRIGIKTVKNNDSEGNYIKLLKNRELKVITHFKIIDAKDFKDKTEAIIVKDKNNQYYIGITTANKSGIRFAILVSVKYIISREIERIFKNTIFIPASKSGLLLLSGYLAKTMVEEIFSREKKLVKYIMLEDKSKEKEFKNLPEPIIQFIKNDPTYSRENYSSGINREFAEIVQFLETKLIRGNITYNRALNSVIYTPSLNTSITLPPQHSSSLVAESIPLILYLKHSKMITKKTLIILEEPEAHLHPDAQRILARALVKLVNRGVYVVLITHSPYILQQINNNIKLYYLKKAGKEKELKEFLKNHGWEEDEILDPSKVAPYLFDDNEGYTKIRELEIFKDEGISSEAFYYTIMELLKETEELTELLSGSHEKYGEEYDSENS